MGVCPLPERVFIVIVNTRNPAYRATFSSDPQDVPLARTAIAGFARLCGFDDVTVCDVRLAAGEALNNACEHGGGYSVHCDFDDGVLRIEIEDNGAGFEAPPELTTIQPNHRNRGFGIFLMRQLMDEVTFAGNRVQLRVRRREVTRVSVRRANPAQYRARRVRLAR